MPPPPDPIYVLRTHSAPLASVSFSADNTVLYSGDQDGHVSITDLPTRRSILLWKAHNGGILGVDEWDGRLISHGRDNLIHIYNRIPLIRRSGQINLKSGPIDSGSTPGIWKSLTVNSLNFCRFSILPILSPAASTSTNSAEAEALLSVPNLIDTEQVDVYHIPSMKRLHAGVNAVADGKGKAKAKAGPADATRSGLVMSIHLRFVLQNSGDIHRDGEERRSGKLVLVLGYEDGRVDVWGMPEDDARAEKGKEVWRSFSDGSGQVGQRRWEVLWSGKGHNEAVMAMTVSSDAQYAYTVSADHLLVTYDISEGIKDPSSPNLIHPYSTKQIGNASIAISSSDTIIAVGGWDGKVRLFSAASGKALGTLGYHRETVQCLAFPCGVSISAELGETVDVSTIELGEEDSDEDEEASEGKRGNWFVSGGKDRRVAIWELMDFEKKE